MLFPGFPNIESVLFFRNTIKAQLLQTFLLFCQQTLHRRYNLVILLNGNSFDYLQIVVVCKFIDQCDDIVSPYLPPVWVRRHRQLYCSLQSPLEYKHGCWKKQFQIASAPLRHLFFFFFSSF